MYARRNGKQQAIAIIVVFWAVVRIIDVVSFINEELGKAQHKVGVVCVHRVDNEVNDKKKR